MEKQIIISYNWSNDEDANKPIEPKHREDLEEHARKRIFEQVENGFSSGELIYTFNLEDISYSGWWSITTKTV